MKWLLTLIKFIRPHTVIGSIISISTLFIILVQNTSSNWQTYFFLAIIIAITCNIFIVGLNQIADVNIDKINKPNLPIPAGELTTKQAKLIVFLSLGICLVLSLLVSVYLFVILALATFIGWAYSYPPFYLKKHHVSAALSIAVVRGILINLGGFLVFNYLINQSLEIPQNILILTCFIFAFSIVIAWFKDLPDITGDAKYNVKTLAIVYNPQLVFYMGNVLVAIAYLVTIILKYNEVQNQGNITLSYSPIILLWGHVTLLVLFIANALLVKQKNIHHIKQFYKRFWWFFFAEYLLYFVAYL